MPRRRVVAVIEIVPQFPAVTRNPRLIVPNVAAVPPVTILGKHRSSAHSDQQQNPSYHAFHIFPSPWVTAPLDPRGHGCPETASTACKPASRRQVARFPIRIFTRATCPGCY